jgi:carbon storage regulator
MLVLTRKRSEKLYIGPDICITVVRLEGGQVRLGIEAPREIPVLRAELVAGASSNPKEGDIPYSVHPPVSNKIRPLPRLVHGIGIRRRAPSR